MMLVSSLSKLLRYGYHWAFEVVDDKHKARKQIADKGRQIKQAITLLHCLRLVLVSALALNPRVLQLSFHRVIPDPSTGEIQIICRSRLLLPTGSKTRILERSGGAQPFHSTTGIRDRRGPGGHKRSNLLHSTGYQQSMGVHEPLQLGYKISLC
ncbi:unnamed protein product [Rhizoctonia solani]|uniref:Uncharacterized protein n=1 Tax=Rhizoctonia solani TaxID=456999 RepID=A0A8H3BQW5_9AGAM|nr:unnamed protein product [Rhizoctonia solani]